MKKKKTETPTNFQSNLQSDSQIPDLILKSNDLPGLVLEIYQVLAIPKSSIYNVDYSGIVEHGVVLPLGTRNVGEVSMWRDKSGRYLKASVQKFDSSYGLKEEIETMQQNAELSKCRIDEREDYFVDFGDPNIGDTSFYIESGSKNQPDVSLTELRFIYKNNYIILHVMDEKGKSKNEAIRIAKIIKSRLD